jgi:hypothetical protein
MKLIFGTFWCLLVFMVIANGTTEIRGLAGTWVHTAETVTMPAGRTGNVKKMGEI